jgi:glutamyl-tRNA reductase
MTIVCLSLSHRFVPAEVLEKLAVPAGELGEVLARLRAVPGVDEAVVLSTTCNREEVYAAVSGPAGRVTGAVADLLAARGHVQADEITRTARTLLGAAAAVTATGAATPVVTAGPVRAARVQVGVRPLFILDLGMPPDVEPAVGRLAGVTLADLTALGQHLADHAGPDQIPQARAIVAAEAAKYAERQQQAAATPVIAAMHAQIRQLADAELARLHDRLPELSEHQRVETAATVHRILGKVLHPPTVRVREFSSGPEGRRYLDALRELFDLPAAEAKT